MIAKKPGMLSKPGKTLKFENLGKKKGKTQNLINFENNLRL